MASKSTERAKRAIEAMQPLGFSKKLTANVLRQLLKLYSNNWELIEDDNYRALADAILDAQENVNEETAGSQEPCIARTRARTRAQEDHGQSTPVNNSGVCAPGPSSSKRHRQEPGGASAEDEDLDQGETETETQADLLLRKRPRRISTNGSISIQSQIEDRAIVLAPPQPSPTELSHRDIRTLERSTQGSTSIDPQSGAIITYQRVAIRANTVPLKEPKLEPGLENEIENGGDQPLAVIYPDSGSQKEREAPVTPQTDTTSTSKNPNPDSSGEMDKNETVVQCNGHVVPDELASVPDHSGTKLDVGSSSDGLVKLTFLFPTRPDVRAPSLDDFFKMVEDRCLKSFKILKPNLSLPNLMNEMCQLMAEQVGTCAEAGQSPTIPVVPAGTDNISDNNTEMVPVPKPHLDLGEIRPAHDVNDICKGLERLAIPVINEYSTDNLPSHFTYLAHNLPYQNAYLCFTLTRIGDENCCADCFGNCVSAPVPCACVRETGGEFRYTNEGLLRTEFLDECVGFSWDIDPKIRVFCQGSCPFERLINEEVSVPCKGHVARKFIKECWAKCGCSMQCENRVVQRGMMCRLQVFMTPDGRGWGLRTLDEIPKGTFVCEYVGEVLTTIELNKRYQQNKDYGRNMNLVRLDADCGSPQSVGKDQDGLHLDPTFYGNIGRFINHRCCDANLVDIPVEIESPDHHYYHLALFATRKVEALEELTWDYGMDFAESENSGKGFKCKCGSKYCRNIQRSRKEDVSTRC